jgi:hypothetical protein
VTLPDDLTLTHHTSAEAAELMDKLCEVYADAYGAVPDEDIGRKPAPSRSGQARRRKESTTRW